MALRLGCMGLSFRFGPATEESAAIELVQKAVDIPLHPDDLHRIAEAVSEINLQGARHPQALQQLVGR
jgi:hypothetical protein